MDVLRPQINILTSCNNNLSEYILPQIVAIGTNLVSYTVDFYIMHRRISDRNIQSIRAFTKTYPNINLFIIFIEDKDNFVFEKLAYYGGRWPYEAYYWLLAHKYLPKIIDRILYIDAGDIIINGDISEYYFQAFEEMILIATAEQMILRGQKYGFYNSYDLKDNQAELSILERGILNSGSVVINIKKLRNIHFSELNLHNALNSLKERYPEQKTLYFGDQGLASFLFIDSIKFFSNPSGDSFLYMPYNFCLWYFKETHTIWYTPKIIHYTGIFYKPWQIHFNIHEVIENSLFSTSGVQYPYGIELNTLDYYEIWWNYCALTTIYEKTNKQATNVASKLMQWFKHSKNFSYKDNG